MNTNWNVTSGPMPPYMGQQTMYSNSTMPYNYMPPYHVPPNYHHPPPPPMSMFPPGTSPINSANAQELNTWKPEASYQAVNNEFYPTQFNYNPICESFPASNCVKSVSKRESDEMWVNDWLRQNDKIALGAKKKENCVKIADAKMMFASAFATLNELKQLHSRLSEESNDDDTFKQLTHKTCVLKDALQNTMTELSRNETPLLLKMKQIAAKRKRLRIKKQKLKDEAKDSKQKREELHEQIDSWQKKIYDANEQRKRDKMMKDDADQILSEVRKKQAEAKKALDLIQSLQKLRTLRKQVTEKRGLYTTKESDNKFSDKMTQMETMLRSQMEDYQAEEKALRVMLESSIEAEEKLERQAFDERLEKTQHEIHSYFFGEEVVPMGNNFPLWSYYNQAENDLHSFLRIRHEWDQYRIPDELSTAQDGVPVTWVYPEEPSSEKWNDVLEQNDSVDIK